MKVDDVYTVFKEYFGEDKVDLQNSALYTPDSVLKSIIVWFPEVTVTNERGNSIDITDLYVKTEVNDEGIIYDGFTMVRGSYTNSQFQHHYLHSHARGIPGQELKFSSVCLGDGPLTGTIAELTMGCDLDRWRLYCFELEKYVQIESLAGGPYYYLDQVTKAGLKHQDLLDELEFRITALPQIIKDFTPYFVARNLLKFCLVNGRFMLGQSPIECMSLMTTAFKNYLLSINITDATSLLEENVLYRGIYKDGSFYTLTPLHSSARCHANQLACYFKGKQIRIKIIHDTDNNLGNDIIINPIYAYNVLHKIINVLNYGRYFTGTTAFIA